MKHNDILFIDENEKNLFLRDDYARGERIDSLFTYKLSAQSLIDLKKMTKDSVQGRLMVLSAIIKVLLYRYTAESKIKIGIPHLDGLKGSTLTLITENISSLSFKEVILGIQQGLNQDISVANYNLEVPSVIVAHDSLHKDYVTLRQAETIFAFEEAEESLILHVHYSSSLFTQTFIEQVAGHVQALSDVLLKNPKELVSNVQFLTDNEIFYLTQQLFSNSKEYDSEILIHQLFEKQAALTPNQTAVIFKSNAFTYEYINEESNKLAHYLQEKYLIKPDDPIGLLLERSEKTIVTILAILKSGGCYVPMDPTYPEYRIIDIINDSDLKLLITEEKYTSIELNKHVPLMIPEEISTDIEEYSSENPDNETQSSNLAYIIFTSGSTGKPKGVMVKHHNIVNLVTYTSELIPTIGNSTCLAVNSFSFDLSVIDLFLCLSYGMKIVIHPYDDLQYENFDRYLSLKENVTFLQTTPSRLKLLIGDKNSKQFLNSLHIIMTSGESLPLETIKKLRELTDAKIYNMYGPTETTVWSTGMKVPDKLSLVSAGVPVPNTQLYVLDENLQLVPKGAIGEICIGGEGVARGYINQEELTASRFIEDPFVKAGNRIYRSGDLGRILPDDTICILRRMDSQIKLNGFRIELEEIENVLKMHPLVLEAIVIIHEELGKERLSAYLNLTGNTVTENEIFEFLRKKLPNYMVPHKILRLSTIPLTTNGKLDAKNLHKYSQELIKEKKEIVSPRNKIEEELYFIFKETLEIENFCVHDNFFEIGGHSLMALKLIGLIQERLNKEISLGEFFIKPTIAEVAYNLSENELQKVNRRYNLNFSPDSYYYFFPCIYAAVIEKMKHEFNIRVKKSFIPAIEGYPLLGYSYALKTTDRAKGLEYMAPPFGKLADFESNEERFDIRTTNHTFDNLEAAIVWCEDQLSKERLIVANVNTYFLHYTSDYMLDPDYCLEKFKDKYKRNEPFLSHTLILVDITNEGYVVFDSNFNYFGLVPKDDFHKAFEKLKGLSFLKDHPAYQDDIPYSVADIDVSKIKFKEEEITDEIYTKIIRGYFIGEEIMHIHEGMESRAFIGLRAIKELISNLQEYSRDRLYYRDVRFLIQKLFFVWNHTFLFLHDFLQDVSSRYPVNSNDLKDLLNISNKCKEWSLNIENVNDIDFEDYINNIVSELEQIYLITSTLFYRLNEETNLLLLQE
ncbi:non-ribosomal peptide synthetase [Bacillus wiedmannii]|uniref:non-ribosomal peptide synthetase n=1 Tax=Bacillus wiedmannii TaxID=1890302 RepID=UPI000B431C27|nr:hypothetical protein BK740_00490 [Bacillus thuringiensis serovar argentinensis]